MVGALLVIIFMVVYYSAGGIIAVFSVGTNVLLVIACLAGIFQATFTLPGMAALVLTIGMAVDANILIFERIRKSSSQVKALRMLCSADMKKHSLPLSMQTSLL